MRYADPVAQAEIDRLRAENARAVEVFDRDQRFIKTQQAEIDSLRAKIARVEDVIAGLERDARMTRRDPDLPIAVPASWVAEDLTRALRDDAS